jgi:putative tryptophan/tyrosine transport system substrate-binding protein
MKRGALVSLIAAAAATWPPPLAAQQSAIPVIGFLYGGTKNSLGEQYAAFHRGLGEAGYVNGQNVTIEYRGADDHYDRLPGLADELARRPVTVIVAAGGPAPALAAKAATASIPVVFTIVADPVKSGLVAGFNRPGGNVTGSAGLTSALDSKRLELLQQLKPAAKLIGVLVNPNRPGVDGQLRDLQATAKALGQQLLVQKTGTERDIGIAFEALAQQKVEALLVAADPFFNSWRAQIVAFARHYAIPAIYQWSGFVTGGGLMSYGPSIADAYHQAGIYAGRILKGAKPADLPVMQPTTFELVINLKTAKALGLEVPPTLLARANKVVE